MRLSLWQQFSSNHSADFTVVGTFENAEAAAQAGEELRSILNRLDQWWKALDRDEFGRWRDHSETPVITPIEKQISTEYEVKWPFMLSWPFWGWDRSESPVQVYREFVFVIAPLIIDFWCGPQPFDSLLERLNGEVAVFVAE